MTLAIDIEHLSKRFSRSMPGLRKLFGKRGPVHVDALSDLSLSVRAGEVFGLVGRNGQGKTTLIKSVCGLIEPSHGSVRVFGYDSVRDLRELKRRIGLVSADERSFYFRLTGRENLRFFGRLVGVAEAALAARIEALSQTFELTPVLDRAFQEYSTGNKQRLAIARALLSDPPLLLLDEPTRSLDPLSAEGLRNVIDAWAREGSGKTVVITTHNLAEIERLCGRVAILSRGKLIECAPIAELKQKYLGEERVQLSVSGEVSEAALSQLQKLEGVVFGARTEGLWSLALTRRIGDERLDGLLRALLLSGFKLESVRVEQAGLVEVLARVEAGQP
jgi:ABC-2 type transport system ATP-binding protein